MSDLINRQAAIDAAISADMENHSGILSEKRARVIDRHISAVPSAQSEETCDTCQHSPFGDSRCEECRVGRMSDMSYPSYYERRTDER